MAHPVLFLTGMTPDPRVCERLHPAVPASSIVPWIRPMPGETICSYASRLAANIEVAGRPIVCGVSFGGIVARELAWRLNAHACVLISSVRSPGELPPWQRAARILAGRRSEWLCGLMGRIAMAVPDRVRAAATLRLAKLSGPAGAWHRWATSAVLRWQPTAEVTQVPVLQIHGSCDSTFPIRHVRADRVIEGGGHLIALTHAKEIGAAIARLAEHAN